LFLSTEVYEQNNLFHDDDDDDAELLNNLKHVLPHFPVMMSENSNLSIKNNL